MFTFTTVIPNMNNKQGINTINANKIGNNTVQQKDINWSKRILGKEALTQMNTNINTLVLIAKFKGEEDIFIIKSKKIVSLTLKNTFKILIKISKGIILK